MLLEGAHVEVGFAAGLQVTSELDLLLLYAQTLYIYYYLIGVDKHVLLEVGSGGELFPTEIACVRLLSRVDPFMSDKVTDLPSHSMCLPG
jgi:hypothetical protein